MKSHLAIAACLTALTSGCAGEPPAEAPTDVSSAEPDTARVPTDSPPAEPITDAGEPLPQSPDRLEIIRPGEVVPAFKLTTEDGTLLDSEELVGTKPFVMVFFASWCKVCERKLPEVRKALDTAGDGLLVVGVALDNPETWDQVSPYMKRHGITDFKLVKGQANRKFATAYNPFGSVPVVEVIDRSGVIAELQRGWKDGHREDLVVALQSVSSSMSAP